MPLVVRLYEEFLSGKTVDYIARIFRKEKIKSWDGKCNWLASTLDSMLRNEKYMGDTILQKSYTADFLSKKRVMNDGTIQMYHIEEDHEPIIDVEIWEDVQSRPLKQCSRSLNAGSDFVKNIVQTLMRSIRKQIHFQAKWCAEIAITFIPG